MPQVADANIALNHQPLDCKQGRHAQLHDRAANTCRLADCASLQNDLPRFEAGAFLVLGADAFLVFTILQVVFVFHKVAL